MAVKMTREQRRERREALIKYATDNRHTLREIAEHFGLSAWTVRAILRVAGVPVASAPPNHAKSSTYSIIADLFNTDATYAVIAAKYNVTRQRVGEVAGKCLAAGIPIRQRQKVTDG